MSQRVLVLREHRLVASGEPGEEIGGDPLVVRPTTKFETRGRRLGHGVWDVVATLAEPADLGFE